MNTPTYKPPPTGPSLLVKVTIGPMTRVLNPLVEKLAGRRHFPMAAQLSHVGRRSGRGYVTPGSARVSGEVAMIPLTIGNQSDWSKNVLAAGGAAIRVNGRDYRATEPEFLDRQAARPLLPQVFNPVIRASFRLLGIQHASDVTGHRALSRVGFPLLTHVPGVVFAHSAVIFRGGYKRICPVHPVR